MGARLVFYHQLRDGVAAYLRSIATKQLVESHQAIEYARCGLALDNHTLLLYFQGVCLLVWKALVQGEGHGELTALLDVSALSGILAIGIQSASSFLQDSLGMLLFVSQSVGSHHLPVSCHLQRSRLGIHLQFHRSRNQTGLRVAYFPSLLHLAKESVPACRLAVEFFAAPWHHQFHTTHIDSRESRSGSLWRNLGIYLDELNSFEIGESKLTQLWSTIDSNGFQLLTAREGGSTHLGYTLRNHHFLQVIAGKECLTSYLLQLIWQDDVLQMMTGMEGVLRENGTCSLAQVKVSQLPGEIAKLSEIGISRGCQSSCQLQVNSCRFLLGTQIFHVGHGLCRHGRSQQCQDCKRNKFSHTLNGLKVYILLSLLFHTK